MKLEKFLLLNVIEHNIDVMKLADYIIDVGPDGGTKGGEIVFSGTPQEMYENADTITAKYLRKDETNKIKIIQLHTIGKSKFLWCVFCDSWKLFILLKI